MDFTFATRNATHHAYFYFRMTPRVSPQRISTLDRFKVCDDEHASVIAGLEFLFLLLTCLGYGLDWWGGPTGGSSRTNWCLGFKKKKLHLAGHIEASMGEARFLLDSLVISLLIPTALVVFGPIHMAVLDSAAQLFFTRTRFLPVSVSLWC